MYPSQTADRFMIRMPDGLRDQLRGIAAQNRRSMNSEIVLMLERALRGEEAAGNGPEKASPAARNDDRVGSAVAHQPRF